jgi:hypothetical protein
MPDFDTPISTCCCVPPAPGLRLLTFPDGTQAGVFGLEEAFAAVYAKGGKTNAESTEEIIDRLSVKNYIAPTVRQKYRDLIAEEYGRYVIQEGNHHKQETATREIPGDRQRTRWFRRLFKRARLLRT